MGFKFKNESELVKLISGILKRPSNQVNKVNESDPEIIDRGDEKFLFNTDTFSGEDFFDENDPYSLGWNSAVGCISDLLAGGGLPDYYAHSMTITESWDKKYVDKFIKGVKDALLKFNAFFIGGDIGFGKEWSYTGSVMSFVKGRVLTRIGAKPDDSVYVSGRIGLGNYLAALKLFSVKNRLLTFNRRLPARADLAAVIKEFASSCIDTSDGVFNSLRIISELNNTAFEIDNIPYHKICTVLSGMLKIDRLLFFIGECGEYELLFTVPPDREKSFLKKSRGLKFYRIGKITESGKRIVHDSCRSYDLTGLDISARSFENKKDFIYSIADYLKRFNI